MPNRDIARFRRNKTIKYKKKRIAKAKRLLPGMLVEFQYGAKKDEESKGGWHGDPRPILLVFYDDQEKYIEGINTNYLSEAMLRELLAALHGAEGVQDSPAGGERLYNLVKSVEPDVLVGYRKYLRSTIRSIWQMQVDLIAEQN